MKLIKANNSIFRQNSVKSGFLMIHGFPNIPNNSSEKLMYVFNNLFNVACVNVDK